MAATRDISREKSVLYKKSESFPESKMHMKEYGALSRRHFILMK